MPVLEAENIPDLIASTQKDLGRMKLTDISRDKNKYIAFNQIMSASRTQAESGYAIQINLLTRRSDNARFKGLYQTDPNVAQDNAQTTGDVPWRFSDFYWAWDENEIAINEGEARIQDYVRLKRYRALLGWAEFIEDWFWGVPPNTSDKKTPYNLRYWIQKDVTTAGIGDSVAGSGSFSGNVPTGADSVAHTDVGGINPSTYPNWKNYTYKYTNVTDADLITRMRKMTRRIMFTPPMGVSYPEHAGPPSHAHYVPEEILNAMELLAETRNDNLGYDFAAKGPTYARAPLIWAPPLDDDADDPIYTLDWGAYRTVYFKGGWMKETPAFRSANQHQVWLNYVNSRFNGIVYDRRRLAVGSRAAANA